MTARYVEVTDNLDLEWTFDENAVLDYLASVSAGAGGKIVAAKNTSGIRPCEYHVLVKPADVEKTTAGGLIIPETKLEKDEYARTEGVLVAMSPRAFTFEGPPLPDDPKVGDRVIFSRYQATELVGRDGGKYWIMKDKSIVAVIE